MISRIHRWFHKLRPEVQESFWAFCAILAFDALVFYILVAVQVGSVLRCS